MIRFSATSVMLPDLDVPETCRLLQRLGYEGVEWRVRYTRKEAMGKPYSCWGRHKTDLSPANLAERAAEVAGITAEHGLAIPGLASDLKATDLEDIRRLAEGAAALGRAPVRIVAPQGYNRSVPYPALYQEAVDAYGKALDVLRPYGVRLLLEIHGGTIMVSASLAHRIASNFPPSEIGVIYDVNNMARDGFETFRIGMDLLGPYLQHCHAAGWRPREKGRKPDGSVEWQWDCCDLADGVLDVPQFMADLKAVGYNGFVSIEDFRTMGHEEKLRRQIEFLRTLQ